MVVLELTSSEDNRISRRMANRSQKVGVRCSPCRVAVLVNIIALAKELIIN